MQQLIDRFSKRVDRRADAFEIYLARNIFNVPEGTRESAGQVRRREGSTEEGREIGREGGRRKGGKEGEGRMWGGGILLCGTTLWGLRSAPVEPEGGVKDDNRGPGRERMIM